MVIVWLKNDSEKHKCRNTKKKTASNFLSRSELTTFCQNNMLMLYDPSQFVEIQPNLLIKSSCFIEEYTY